MNLKIIKKSLFYSLFMWALIFQSCENTTEETQDPQRGDLENTSFQITMTEVSLKGMADESLIPEFAVFDYAATVVTINYFTESKNGEIVPVSGALFIPVNATDFSYPSEALPMLSLQHGTAFERTAVASVSFMNSFEGVLALLSAMGGVVTCVPDYIGFGISEEMHPYIIKEYTANAVVDFLRAAEDYCEEEGINLDGSLVLAGYSEGGYCTMATQKTIEQEYSDEFNLVYSVPMAGPYDLENMVDYILSQENYASSPLMGFILTSYNEYYDWGKLDEIFQTPYNTQVASLYSGDNSYETIDTALPDSMSLFLNPEFISSYLAGNTSYVNSVVEENSLIKDGWIPETPTLLIHGNADEIVPYLNSVNTYAAFEAGGADVEFVTIEGGTHSSSALDAINVAFAAIMEHLGK